MENIEIEIKIELKIGEVTTKLTIAELKLLRDTIDILLDRPPPFAIPYTPYYPAYDPVRPNDVWYST